MFCPKCGNEAQETQRFCKNCGSNLQVVADALGKGEDTLGQLRLDVESLKRHAKDLARGIKENLGDWTGDDETDPHYWKFKCEELEAKRTPKPKDWLGYSWQHNLRDGILSLLSGVGLGIFLYYMGQVAINEGAIRSLEELPNVQLRGLEPLVRMIWLVALIPVLKGLGHIIYAAFFADSIATLTARFLPPQTARQLSPDTARQEPLNTSYASLNEMPSSVTERTTQFFEDAHTPVNRESQ
ncbi:MAG TPA: zinc ribbon domain-containing protein [Blastocatellia bacterium]|nr:zinc ribbon domain-containing protein [Blastocatellia bacterium]